MKKVFSVAMCVAVIGCVADAYATSTTAFNNSGTVFTTTALTGYQTQDFLMYGMEFTFTFADGQKRTAVWGDWPGMGDQGSGVSVTYLGETFEIRMNGDSYAANWVSDGTTGLALSEILIDAGKGNAVFDVWSDSDGTTGSALGYAFNANPSWGTSLGHGDGFNILATYSGQVALNGSAPVGDLYRYLTIDFIDGTFGPDRGDYLTFRADTDNLLISGDLNPIPEPTTMLLFGTGLAGLAAVGRRKVKK